jgi:predicted  nucleic acid-binding Zn-ribbon protein
VMPTELEWAEAFKRLDSGESSYETEAKRLGVGKGTVYRHHIATLQRRINVKKSELSRITDELSKAQQSLQTLVKERRRLEGEIGQAREKLSAVLQELNRVLATYERLKNLGLDKVASLTEFIDGYEALGFSAQQVQKLVVWRQSLAKMGIDPDKLFELAKKRRSLEGQISELEKERRRVEGIVKKLKVEHRRLFEEITSLQAEALKLGKLGKVVKLGMIVVPCKVCGMEGVFVKLHTASEYRGMMRSGAALQYRCIYCGRWAVYTPWEILSAIGLLATPELKEVRTPTIKE